MVTKTFLKSELDEREVGNEVKDENEYREKRDGPHRYIPLYKTSVC